VAYCVSQNLISSIQAQRIQILAFNANLVPINDLKIDLTAGRNYSDNLTESFNTVDFDNDGLSDSYNSMIQNSIGNFNISTVLIKTAFSNKR
jgi:cell surface protein SprA